MKNHLPPFFKSLWNKRAFRLFIAALLLIGVERFCYKKTGGFRYHKILPDRQASYLFEPLPPLSTEEENRVAAILDQPFYFLGKGVQCYAFLSEDGQTVFKVFKHYHTMPSNAVLRQIKLPGHLDAFRQKTIAAREHRMKSIFSSVKLAFENYREETGLLYAHLHPTSHFQKQLTIYDKLGIAYQIDLDQVPFALQKKAELVYPVLDTLLTQGDIEGAKKAVGQLLNLVVLRSKKGIANTDALMRNFGFIGTEAIEIDIGSFIASEYMARTTAFKKELYYESRPLKEWVRCRHPEFLEHFNRQVHAYLNEEF